MLSRSKIPWLINPDGTPGYTWSPTTGCSPASAGCLNCWAKAYHVRYRGGDFSVKLHPEKLDEPLRLRKPSTIGVCLMGDLFHDDVPEYFIRQLFYRMDSESGSRHTYIVLTKRPERMRTVLTTALFTPNNWPTGGLPNVWLGVSVEDQETKHRIDILRDTPAAHRWISLEPQIEDVGALDLRGISLVVQGCESGPRRRPFDVAWARSVMDQCKSAGVAYYLKQMPGSECVFQGPFKNGICEKPKMDGRQHLALPWVAP